MIAKNLTRSSLIGLTSLLVIVALLLAGCDAAGQGEWWNATPGAANASLTEGTPAAAGATPVGPPTPTPRPYTRPVRMVVPALELDIPVVEVRWRVEEQAGTLYSTWDTASDAAGHHFDSAYPGEQGNVVLSGHHNIEGRVFKDISAIGEPGCPLTLDDDVILHSEDGRAFLYRITSWHRFRERGAEETDRLVHARFAGPSDEAILTLVTCWPYVTNTHRVVVVARLVGGYTEN